MKAKKTNTERRLTGAAAYLEMANYVVNSKIQAGRDFHGTRMASDLQHSSQLLSSNRRRRLGRFCKIGRQ